MGFREGTIRELKWKDVRTEVKKVNKGLFSIIEEIDPSSEYTLFKATYPFGAEILKNGMLQVPNKAGHIVPITDPTITEEVRNKLGYNNYTNPVSMILKNSAEIFMILDNHTIPLYGLIKSGKIFSTWRVLNPNGSYSPNFLWNMSSGARSVFMLPKIAEAAGYERLRKELKIHIEKPKGLLDHWKIFRDIVNHPYFKEDWKMEILFFSRKWFDKLNDGAWRELKFYLLERAWEGSEFFRNQFTWNLVFSLIKKERGIKPNPYIADIVKHLISIGTGSLPGFAPTLDNTACPTDRLQEIMVEIYRLVEYTPTLMIPCFLSSKTSRSIYCSLQYPSMIEFSPTTREDATKIFEIYNTKSLLLKYLSDIRLDKYNLRGTPIYDLPEKVEYDFFHTDISDYQGIRLSNDIPIEDSSFIDERFKNSKFSSTAPFMRGCIRIRSKDNSKN